MPNAARVTMFFGQSSAGWSETWWYPDGLSTGIWDKISNLATLRVALLNTQHTLLAARVSEEGANRFTRLVLGGKKTTIDFGQAAVTLPSRGKEDGTGSDLEGPPDQVRAALQIEMVRAGKRIGLRYLAGFPDDVSLTEPDTMNTDFNKKWWKLFGSWRAEIITAGWAIKQLDKGAGFPLINVQTYRLKDAGPSLLGVVTSNAAPFTNLVGDKVALQGVRTIGRGHPSPNGTWSIDSIEEVAGVGQRTIWLRNSEGYDPGTFNALGKIRAVAYTYIAPSWMEPLRVGIHKRGKPFGSPVGRRPTQR